MSAEERRELVLQAGTRAFAHGGYHGTSTDAVAKEAGVSQPYVVRIFGTKLELFLEVFERSAGRIQAAFEEVLDSGPFDPESEEDRERMGMAYTELLLDNDFLQVMMHGFANGDVPEIAAAPKPWTARAAIRAPEESDSADAIEAAVKTTMPAIITRRRPIRSPSVAAGSMKVANASV